MARVLIVDDEAGIRETLAIFLKDAGHDIETAGCVADVVEAMASDRPYRAALGIDAALAEIRRGRGTAYWPDAVDACVQVFREDGYELPARG